MVKDGMIDFGNSGYRIETTAKNISMTTDAFQKLTGAMRENGATSEEAENSIAALYQRANDAVNNRDNGFLALMASNGIGISKTKEGVADVNKLLDDMHGRLMNLSPALQAVFGNAAGLSPELLNYLRLSGDDMQRLKDQAQRDGLFFKPQDFQNAHDFWEQLNAVSAAWDGIKLKSEARLGALYTNDPVAKSYNESLKYANDTPGSFYHGDEKNDLIWRARRDKDFKNTLSFKEGADLAMGYPDQELDRKLHDHYDALWKVQQLQHDVKQLYVQPPPIVNPSGGTSNSLGIRNNNPGNLRAAPNATGYNGGFVTFATPNDGLSALSRQLMLYGDRGNNTLSGIIHTYAPSTENNTQSYINAVSQQTGFDPRQRLNLQDPTILQKLMAAIIQHENGAQPYNQSDITGGINSAILDPRWSGLRNPTILSAQREGNSAGINADNTAPVVTPPPVNNAPVVTPPPVNNVPVVTPPLGNNAPVITPPMGNTSPSINAVVLNSSQAIADAIAVAMKDNKAQIELTIVNSKTGEKTTIHGKEGGKITTSMNLQ
jgi:hypothetical protein